MRVELAAGAWLEHEPAWLSATEADRAMGGLLDELRWEQREIVLFGRRVLQPRLIAWAGELGYRYSGQTLEPRAPTATIERLLAAVCRRVDAPFNHVLLNRYRGGEDSMGFHADDEPELGPDPLIAILSLGERRRLTIKPRRPRDGERRDVPLGHGDLLVMGGTCQRRYVHGVPRQPGLLRERISLTFRTLLRAP
jgi:alkylated DNA repair dioxygenase AlkB